MASASASVTHRIVLASFGATGGALPTEDGAGGSTGVATRGGIRSSTEAYAMLGARTVREKLGTTWGLAETGASGPTGNRYGDAAGHACIAVAGPVERVITIETASADREANMWVFTRAALDLLTSCLEESAKPHR